MSLTVRHHASVDEFLAVAGGFLEAREAEHNLLFGIASAIRATPEVFAEDPPQFASVTDAGGRVVAATLRTPPHNQVLSSVDDMAAVDSLVQALRDEPIPGVLGPTDAAARFAGGWTDATGQPARVQVAERIFRLERVIPPDRPAPGSWRIAQPNDRDLLARWLVAFTTEAVPEAPPLEDPAGTADRWLARRGRVAYLWEDEGQVVSLVGAGGETPQGIRIGPVFTPPALRGRGYASSLTAAASTDQLGRGRRFCFLFTDLGNPTSNKIYRAIGYEPVCDVDQYRFGTDA
ncbi:MAG TPA: GNAT family N-acetyltransferase [Candidatus Limnocylindrales bacterium]|nr:GNAT family N-acetyltransferase [Candidatus Limnocylindrales bacterium]